jgi:ubiquinone/menaquinone biosynthesis C-methylase UbiE
MVLRIHFVMNAIQSIRKIFVPSNRVQSDVDPAVAYDIWAKTYDNQPHNLMLHLDEQVFSELLLGMDLHEKHVIDVGCGTGSHWKTILSQKPVRLQGFDVSANMLQALKQKFPSAETVHTNDELLDTVESHSVDVIISTLTIAHVSDIDTMFNAWKRVLKPGGEILLTDFHPVVLGQWR